MKSEKRRRDKEKLTTLFLPNILQDMGLCLGTAIGNESKTYYYFIFIERVSWTTEYRKSISHRCD